MSDHALSVCADTNIFVHQKMKCMNEVHAKHHDLSAKLSMYVYMFLGYFFINNVQEINIVIHFLKLLINFLFHC